MTAVKGIQGVAGRQPSSSSELKTIRCCGTTSRKEPGLSLVPPSGPCMKVWKAPPGRMSNARTSVVHGLGHHHSFSIPGSLHARHSVARGARTRRVMTRSSASALAATVVWLTIELLLMKPFGKGRHAVGARLPGGPLTGDPCFGKGERLRPELAGPHPPGLAR